jgi:hypothetical protein
VALRRPPHPRRERIKATESVLEQDDSGQSRPNEAWWGVDSSRVRVTRRTLLLLA